MKTALIIQHLAIETIGTIGPLLDQLGYRCRVCLAGRDDVGQIDPLTSDLAVVMGGPVGVYDADNYPFLHSEMKWLRARLAADRPTIGICLGAQLMAAALGAKVYPGPVPELGWSEITLAEGAEHHPIAELAKGSRMVLHWHNDTFELPIGAQLLASTALYQNQAFAVGRRGLALQFHVEVELIGLEQWFVGFTGDIHRLGAGKLQELRSDSTREAAGLQMRAQAFLRGWLDLAALEDRAA